MAPLSRRLLSLLYDAILLAAVLWCAAAALELLLAGLEAPRVRPLFQTYLVIVSAVVGTSIGYAPQKYRITDQEVSIERGLRSVKRS